MLGDTQLLLQSIGSLLLVLVILLTMVFAARWFMQRRPQGGRRLRFLEAMALGSRDKLLLVEIDGKCLLLGVTAHNIRLLTELDAQDLPPAPVGQKETSAVAAQPGLSKQFSQLLGRYARVEQNKDML
jgi:flagellar protein FliO/FliZ|tara:strand:- start:3776 stop:4159 length:384 start_codon:yes stop_codon:yes gene_type:complete